MKNQLVTFASAALLGLAAYPAHAAVVVSNLDPATYTTGAPNPEYGQSVLTGNRPISLTSVLLPQTGGVTTGEAFAVYSRNTDGSLGTSLFTGFTLSFDTASSLATFTVSSAFTLQANSGYWFVLTSPNNVNWTYTASTDYSAAFGATLPVTRTALTSNGLTTPIYYNLADGPQDIQVNGTALPAVPEPSTWAFVGLTVFGGAAFVARRRFAAA